MTLGVRGLGGGPRGLPGSSAASCALNAPSPPRWGARVAESAGVSPPSGVRACPACQRVASSGRRFCGGCRAVLVRNCGACGFGNELDDCWCGGCGRAVPATVRAEPVAPAPPSKVPIVRAPVAVAKPAIPPPPVAAANGRPPVFPGAGAAAAAMLAINRRRGEPAGTAKNDDVADQDQLDALFGAG